MSSMHPAARRYAKAVFALALDDNAVDRVGNELRSVAETIDGSPELAAVLGNPTVTPAARAAVMGAIVARLGLSPVVANAVRLITDHRRAPLLPRIAEAYVQLADERAGKLRAEVVSAQPLTDAQYTRLAAALEKMTGRAISLARRVDPTLIGGVVTRIGDKVYDGSVRARIDEIRQTLLPS
jgi:F-type H+-transporting ATPase subunit delta